MRHLLFLLLVFMMTAVRADGLLLVRVHAEPIDVMQTLQEKLKEYGYTIGHIQKCDTGLEEMGYETDYYKVVFFAKPEQLRYLSNKYQEMIPYLPLKLAIFAEKNDTLISGVNPVSLDELFPQREIQLQLRRWQNDVQGILTEIRQLYPQSS